MLILFDLSSSYYTKLDELTLEFCPDEPEVAEKLVDNNLEIIPEMSPLDDLRQQLKELNN